MKPSTPTCATDLPISATGAAAAVHKDTPKGVRRQLPILRLPPVRQDGETSCGRPLVWLGDVHDGVLHALPFANLNARALQRAGWLDGEYTTMHLPRTQDGSALLPNNPGGSPLGTRMAIFIDQFNTLHVCVTFRSHTPRLAMWSLRPRASGTHSLNRCGTNWVQ